MVQFNRRDKHSNSSFQQTEIESPKYPNRIKQLPSGFLPYNPNTSVYYRPFKFRELEKLSSDTLTKADKLSIALQGIQVLNGDVDSLTLDDFGYITFMRTLRTLKTPQFQLVFNYKNSPYTHIFKPQDIKYMELQVDEKDQPKVTDLPVILTTDEDLDLDFYPVTVGSYIRACREFTLADYTDIENKQITEEDLLLSLLLPKYSVEEAYNLIEDLDFDDRLQVSTIDELLFHGILPIEVPIRNRYENPLYTKALENPVEGEELPVKYIEETLDVIKIRVDNPNILVLPFRVKGDSNTSKIRFGKTPKH